MDVAKWLFVLTFMLSTDLVGGPGKSYDCNKKKKKKLFLFVSRVIDYNSDQFQLLFCHACLYVQTSSHFIKKILPFDCNNYVDLHTL